MWVQMWLKCIFIPKRRHQWSIGLQQPCTRSHQGDDELLNWQQTCLDPLMESFKNECYLLSGSSDVWKPALMSVSTWSVMFYSYCKYLRLEIRCKTTVLRCGPFVFPPILKLGLQPLSLPVCLLAYPDLTLDSFNILMQQWKK